MASLAYSRLPYWRWWRVRRRQAPKRRGGVAKPWNGIIRLAALLVALDQISKHVLLTPEWGWHEQTASWLVWPLLGLLIFAPFLKFPRTRSTAAVVISGCVGNLLSFLSGPIANPFVTGWGDNVVAFNLADAYLVGGFTALAVLSFGLIPRPGGRPE